MLILASNSKTRQNMLQRAGVSYCAEPSRVDEDTAKQSAFAENMPPDEIAVMLADLKARQVALRFPEVMVLGCDQTLSCAGRLFDKPKDSDHVRAHLVALSGKTHQLHSAAVIYFKGQRIWHSLTHAKLEMRSLSSEFITWYKNEMGDKALQSVGAYQIESLGAQLFTKVEGDIFTIMGLPLLELCAFLREHKELKS